VSRNSPTAQALLAQQIGLDRWSHNAYANRSFISSRKCDWANALHDALQVRNSTLRYSPSGQLLSACLYFYNKTDVSAALHALGLAFGSCDDDVYMEIEFSL